MEEDPVKMAGQLIRYSQTLSLSTVTPEGRPWVSDCFVAYDEGLNFFWTSPHDTHHSEYIGANGRVVLHTSNDNMPPNAGLGRGVYIHAEAAALGDEATIRYAMDYLSSRSGEVPLRGPESFLGESPLRIYQAVPDEVRVNKSVVNGEGMIIARSDAIALAGLREVLALSLR